MVSLQTTDLQVAKRKGLREAARAGDLFAQAERLVANGRDAGNLGFRE